MPDAPVSKFVLEMQGGDKGLLVNTANLCAKQQRAIVRFVGQNGKQHRFNPPMKAKCENEGQKKRHGESSGTPYEPRVCSGVDLPALAPSWLRQR